MCVCVFLLQLYIIFDTFILHIEINIKYMHVTEKMNEVN